jgi:DNA gyrase inhibitor GyrI
MSNIDTSLSVSIKKLPSIHVAYIEYKVNTGQGNMHDEIGGCFRRVQAWLREGGYDPLPPLTLGVINMVNGQLVSYDCCVQAPEEMQSGSKGVNIKDLVGGQYAVLRIRKDPTIIGNSIGRFYQEFVPQNHINIDGTRSTYEIYYESTMEYCVPILE